MIDVDYNEYKETLEENMKLIVENHRLKEVEKEHQKLNGELREEIERLNKENEELKKIQCTFLGTGCKAEIERLNNIINELERYLEDEKINLDDYLGCLDDEERHYEIARLTPRYNDFKEIYDKLQELKGDSINA